MFGFDSIALGKMRYTLMHKGRKVITFDTIEDNIVIHNKSFIPFGLRSISQLQAMDVAYWIADRLEVKNSDEMKIVHEFRGYSLDDINRVLKDSYGVSCTDYFWIKVPESKVTWKQIKEQKDINALLSLALLKRKIPNHIYEKYELSSAITSMCSLKDLSVKAILNGFLFKYREDTELEYAARLIGEQIGIDIIVIFLDDDLGIKDYRLNEHVALVRADELGKYFQSDNTLYDILEELNVETNEYGKILNQLQRLYIFHYIIGNIEFNDKSYGILYNTKEFEFIELAPSFEHYRAFAEEFTGESSRNGVLLFGEFLLGEYIDLEALTKRFIINHSDIVKALKNINLMKASAFLTEVQVSQLKERIQMVIDWYGENSCDR